MSRMTKHALRRRSLLAGASSLLAAPCIVRAQGQNGVALVIGNSKYSWEAPLPNVKRDVPEMVRRLQAYGLKTELLQDAGRDAMKRAAEQFAAEAKGASVAVFYFAGHAFDDERASIFLVPTDVGLSDPNDFKELVPSASFRRASTGAANRLHLLDCCRNNPAGGWRQRASLDIARNWNPGGRGPAGETNNYLQLQSTLPGRIAIDGPAGQFSPFAGALLRHLTGAPVDFQALAGQVRRDLLMATEGRQVLWDWNTYDRPFVLNGTARSSGGAAPSASSPRAIELPRSYAYAQQNKLPLMPGILAFRPPGETRHASKSGAYAFEGWESAPSLLIVMAIEEQAADVMLLARVNGRAYWSIAHGTLSGDTLEFAAWDRGQRLTFTWRGNDGGGVTILPSENTSYRPVSSKFTRLEG